MWQHWVNLVLGLWVLALPFIGITGSALIWTLAVSGIVIAALALWGAQETTSGREMRSEARRLQHQ